MLLGRAKVGGGIPPKVFLSGLAFLIVSGTLYFFNAQAELEEQRNGVLTKQRATAQLLGPRLFPLREKVETLAQELAKDSKDFVDSGVKWDGYFSQAGVYLRVRMEEAQDPEKLRATAAKSLRDGFTSCLIRDATASLPTSGKSCKVSKDCDSGEYCNEFKACQRPSSPFNMRVLYRALLVLSDKWVENVKEAGNDIELLAQERSLDSITEVEIPIAIDVSQRAKFAIVVVDEDPKDGLPEPIGSEFESLQERVQRTAHYARVGVVDLESGKVLARIRAEAAGELRDAGTRRAPGGAASAAARARQANSCGLAMQFQARLSSDEESERREEAPKAASDGASRRPTTEQDDSK